MCKPASMVIIPKNKVIWSEKTDSHYEIIKEFDLRETDRLKNPAVVPVEITPPNGDLSLPLEKWKFSVDFAGFKRELPDWWDAEKAEKEARAALPHWAEHKLKGWKVKEAFHPIRPFKRKPVDMSRDELLDLVQKWDSVRASVGDSVKASVKASVEASVWASVEASVEASVWDSVEASVWDSVGASVEASVWDSVGASVWDSVEAYTGSLFHNIKKWQYTDIKNPWRALRKLWISGYVPSFDGKTWRLHAHADARIVFEFSKEEVAQK